MRAIPKTEQAAAGNSDPFDREARSKADDRYQGQDASSTATVTKFPRKHQSLRRRASIRLSELYRLAQFRQQHRLAISPNDFLFVMAATLACGAPGKIIIRGRVNRTARLEARPQTIAWDGLSMPTLEEAVRRADLGHFDDDELHTVIKAVKRFTDQHGPRMMRDKQLGERLQLTSVERQECRIHTIDAVDEPKADRLARQKVEKQKRDREEKRSKRGRLPRSVYEERSVSKAEPWKAEGVSRATWYRRRETGPGRETGVSLVDISSTPPPTHLSHGMAPSKNQTEQGPARAGGGRRGVGADGPSPGGKTRQVAARRTGSAGASGKGGFEVGALTPRPRIADPGEPPLPQLSGRTAQTVALVEAACDVLATMSDRLIGPTGMTLSGIRETLDGLSDLLWVVAEVDPEGVEETARIIARDSAEILMVAAANDNRICALAERLAA